MHTITLTIAAGRYRLRPSRDLGPVSQRAALSPTDAAWRIRAWAAAADRRAWAEVQTWWAEACSGAVVNGDHNDSFAEALARLLECGAAVLTPVQMLPLRTAGAKEGPPASKGQSAPRQREETWFEVSVIDEVGEPIGQLPCTIVADDEQALTTDSGGKVRREHTHTSRGNFRLSDMSALCEVMKARWDEVRQQPWVEQGADTTMLALRPKRRPAAIALFAETPHTVVIQPWVECIRLLGGHFDSNKCFVLPSAMKGLRAARRHFSDDDAALLIVGHTDTSGEPDVNDPLSVARAEAVRALLLHNTEAWLRYYEQSAPPAQRWAQREDGAMLQALPDYAAREEGTAAVRWFQQTRGLTVDGWAGPQTRKKLIGEYFAQVGAALTGSPIECHGCGESFPLEDDSTAEGSTNTDNRADSRRVELFLFDRALGVQPPAPAGVSGLDADAYPEWVRRARRTEDFAAVAVRQRCHLSYVLLAGEGQQPLGGEPYRLRLNDGETYEGETDAKGRVQYGLLSAGDYTLDVAGTVLRLAALETTVTDKSLIVKTDTEEE